MSWYCEMEERQDRAEGGGQIYDMALNKGEERGAKDCEDGRVRRRYAGRRASVSR